MQIWHKKGVKKNSVKSGYVFDKPKDIENTNDIQDSKSMMLPNTRPIIRAARQNHTTDKKDYCRGAELVPIKQNAEGST